MLSFKEKSQGTQFRTHNTSYQIPFLHSPVLSHCITARKAVTVWTATNCLHAKTLQLSCLHMPPTGSLFYRSPQHRGLVLPLALTTLVWLLYHSNNPFPKERSLMLVRNMDCEETGQEEIWEHSYMNTFYSLICKLRFLMFFCFYFFTWESPSPLNDSV